MSDKGFENTLCVMILGLCFILFNFGVVPGEIKWAYYIFVSICVVSAVTTILMNILTSLLPHLEKSQC